MPDEKDTNDKPPSLDTDGGSEEWDNWQWQMQNRIRSFEELYNIFDIDKPIEDSQKEALSIFPMAITPYYASLIKNFDETDPIYLMAVAQKKELHNPSFLCDDPLNEEEHTVVPGLVHRYPDRVLLLATTCCATYCRHCTRKRIAGSCETAISKNNLDVIINYIENHKEIHDVIISGGDPLTLQTKLLEKILYRIRNIKHVDIIRIGTRTPVTLPMRIDNYLVTMLAKYNPIFINTHFNHPNELTKEAQFACRKIVDAGIPVGNQSVLLKNINDNVDTMIDLCRKLLTCRVKPYYLFQCDLVKGVEHFRTNLDVGLDLIDKMRGNISGLGIPTFILDAPKGMGKIALSNQRIVSIYPDLATVANYAYKTVEYPNPEIIA